jgi:hypothetical protein
MQPSLPLLLALAEDRRIPPSELAGNETAIRSTPICSVIKNILRVLPETANGSGDGNSLEQYWVSKCRVSAAKADCHLHG